MRRALALIAFCLTATAAQACPPPPPGYVPLTREQLLARQVGDAQAIVYALVERSIGSGDVDYRTGQFAGDPGTIRIVHVYKGELRAGQRLRLFGVSWDTDCGSFHYEARMGHAGAYGVLFLDPHGDRDGLYPFTGFVPAADVAAMIRLGLIQSARAAAR
jgi:hypothetical protein